MKNNQTLNQIMKKEKKIEKMRPFILWKFNPLEYVIESRKEDFFANFFDVPRRVIFAPDRKIAELEAKSTFRDNYYISEFNSKKELWKIIYKYYL